MAFPGDVAAAVVRVTTAGALDGSFGSGGLAVLGPLQGRAPVVSVTGTGAIVAIGAWTARTGGIASAARLRPGGALDETFGASGELVAGATPTAGVLDCQGDLLVSGNDGVRRFGPDGRLDRTFRGAGIPPVAVGGTSTAAGFDSLALGSDGSLLLSGTAAAGPIVIGGAAQSGTTAIAVARVAASCPIADQTRPTVTLACAAACRRVAGAALDDPDRTRGPARPARDRAHRRSALRGLERPPLHGAPCGRAAARLIDAPLVRGAFRTPPLGSGRFVVRAVAIDAAGNRSRVAVRRVSR